MSPPPLRRSSRQKAGLKTTGLVEDEDEGLDAAHQQKRRRRKEQFDALHQEMELVQHSTSTTGHARKKVSKQDGKQRTAKRKLLEAVEQDELDKQQLSGKSKKKKIRGSKAAIEDRVVQGSLVFGGSGSVQQAIDDEEEDHDEASEQAEESDESGESEEEIEQEEEGEDDEDYDTPRKTKKAKSTPTSTAKRRGRSTGKRRIHQRLRNFRSAKMATLHGDALGAHAQGKPGLAIRRLRRVAEQAPSAPQIYSSLGLVYEDMMLQVGRQRVNHALQTNSNENQAATAMSEETEALIVQGEDSNANNKVSEKVAKEAETGAETRKVTFQDSAENTLPASNHEDKLLTEQLNLAKKAYGSYHIAALLCKRDYTLWLRAADSACEIAALHSDILALPDLESAQLHRAEKLRWLEEAKNDYQTADNLNPPGIDIPAKLASTMMKLGLLSEALSILTDLKNNDADAFDGSYQAWMLYADLMLRIGHECTQWNRGIQTNSNYMFRRWLRKLSTKFNWQERRLQSLVKALQAAVGSHNCVKLVHWLKNRLANVVVVDEVEEGNTDAVTVAMSAAVTAGDAEERNGDTGDENNAESVGPTGASENERSNVEAEESSSELQGSNDSVDKKQFEQEKELLLATNKTKLAAFDKTTREMELEPGSVPFQEREEARSELIRKHKAALVTLVGEFYHQQQQQDIGKASFQGKNEEMLKSTNEYERDLPLSASCATVCSIASELMRHMLGMDLYDGGKLVAEAVSKYLKERAAVRDKRKREGNEFDAAQQRPTSLFAMHHEVYDEEDQNGSDTESSDNPLSDDDDLDNGDDAAMLEPMRRGTLPPELSLLYGLCLAGEGGKAFLAGKCLLAILDLPQEPCSWLTEQKTDTSLATDSVWQLFHAAMSEPLGRTAAFVLVADVLRRSGQERALSERIAPLFRQHIDDMTQAGMVNVVMNKEQKHDLISRQRQNQVVKIVVAETRYRVYRIEALNMKDEIATGDDDQESVFDAVDSLTKLLSVVWKVEADGSISSTSVEAIDTLARTFRLLSTYSQHLSAEERFHFVRKTAHKMIKPISIICDTKTLTIGDNLERSFSDLAAMPLSSSWLSQDLAPLSLRTFNACVATNVSLFSGWESEEFSIRMMRGSGRNFFGVSMDSGPVAGYIEKEREDELVQQWKMLQQLLPKPIPFDFQAKLSELKDTTWYKVIKERHEKAKAEQRICFYGEENALSTLLDFSRVCLISASMKGENKLIFTALSILLPISQFCLNTSLWNAAIGQQRTSNSSTGVSEWQVSSSRDGSDHLPPSKRPEYVRPCQRAANSTRYLNSDRTLHDWFSFEVASSPLSNLISMPLTALLRDWRICQDTAGSVSTGIMSSWERMQNVDKSVKKLRMCFTEQALEKASLQVARNILYLAAAPDCHNPFLCLQQAALFAGQAPKRGTSDQPFQSKLPAPEMCTPLEALLTLGRADCLRAVYFCQEAAFLCSYVAMACRIRRNSDEWNARWKIVSLLAYDLSVMIRFTSGAVMLELEKREDIMGTWDLTVVDEFESARSEGLIWKAEEIPNGVLAETSFPNSHTAASISDYDRGEHAVQRNANRISARLEAAPAMNKEFDVEEHLQRFTYADEDDGTNAPKLFAV